MAAGLVTVALAAILAMVAGVLVGSVALEPAALWDSSSTGHTILVQLRIPRVLLAATAGAALAVAGAALQPALRNPLASPEIIGVSGGAALAAVASLAFLPQRLLVAGVVPLLAFLGAALSSVLVYRLAHVRGRLDPYAQVLIGVIFNTFAAAMILVIHAVVEVTRSHAIVFWLMGGVAIEPYGVVAVAALLVVVAGAFLVGEAHALNLLALGDETAQTLGVSPARTRTRVFAASSVLVGAVVSLCGIITFAGLIVPHVLRRLLGSDNRLLVPASFFGGAAFLVACDTVARWIAAPAELPVGAITALTGGPFFVYLLRRQPWRGGEL
jgi:iron complex transport system permease protein